MIQPLTCLLLRAARQGGKPCYGELSWMHRRVAAAVAAAALLLPAGQALGDAQRTTTTTASGKPLSASRWLVDSAGRVLEVHGLNIVVKRPPYTPASRGIGADDARFLRAHGFTAVRLGVLMEALEPTPGHYDDSYLRAIVQTADLLNRYGIRSLIDFHQDLYATTFKGEGLPTWMVDDGGVPNAPNVGFPTNYFVNPALWQTFENFWADAGGPDGKPLQTWFAEAWQHVASAFRGNPAVLGYDIFNEPWVGAQWLTCLIPVGCPGPDKTDLVPFINRVVQAIHKVDPGHLAFFEPWQSFSEGASTYVGAPGDARTGLSFHVYCAAALGAPETPPSRDACNFAEQRAMDHAVTQGTDAHEPILLSEFGATTDTSELSEVESYADAHSIPWLEWAYCACADPTGSGSAEALVYNPQQPPRGANVDGVTLSWLDEPYPLATAGTPLGYSFNHSTSVFSYRYSTKSAVTGGSPGSGLTVIYTSPLHYPHGYRVDVSGAQVVGSGSTRLLLETLPGSSTVSVTLRPA